MLNSVFIRTAYKDTKLNSIEWQSNRIDERWVTEELRRHTYTNGPSTFSYNCLPNCRSVFPLYLFFTAIFLKP